MTERSEIRRRTERFCETHGLGLPVLLAPMAGACPPGLSIAVAKAGGLGACGALLMRPDAIEAWADAVRKEGADAFQINLWIPDPAPRRDAEAEARMRAFLGQWGPELGADAGDGTPPDFEAQCEAMLAVRPPIISSIMGVYPVAFVERMKEAGIAWFATATSVAEARAAEAAGADAVIAQGSEAGGHRGAFEAAEAERTAAGLFALLPAIADAVRLPVIAAGGIADGRTAAAAILLGASAVMVGTGFLRCPEAELAPAWAEGIAAAQPEDTLLTRAFSGRLGRGLATDYARAAGAEDAPPAAPYPVQRSLTNAMRREALAANDLSRMQAWSGQAGRLAQAKPAGALTQALWESALALLD